MSIRIQSLSRKGRLCHVSLVDVLGLTMCAFESGTTGPGFGAGVVTREGRYIHKTLVRV